MKENSMVKCPICNKHPEYVSPMLDNELFVFTHCKDCGTCIYLRTIPKYYPIPEISDKLLTAIYTTLKEDDKFYHQKLKYYFEIMYYLGEAKVRKEWAEADAGESL